MANLILPGLEHVDEVDCDTIISETSSKIAICPVEECNLTIDVVLKSSDGALFGAHQRNLEIYTEGFPLSGSTVVSGPVSLTETADVLGLILRYTHHIRQPSVDNISFGLLASLAEAVEKYLIYSAMEVCKIKMTQATYDHPNEVFCYSAKHGYPDLTAMAVNSTLKNRPFDFLIFMRNAGLHDDIAFRWLRYRDRWMEILVQLPTSAPEPHRKCLVWNRFQLAVFEEIRRDIFNLERFAQIVETHREKLQSCHVCCSRSDGLTLAVKKKVKDLPKYSEA